MKPDLVAIERSTGNENKVYGWASYELKINLPATAPEIPQIKVNNNTREIPIVIVIIE